MVLYCCVLYIKLYPNRVSRPLMLLLSFSVQSVCPPVCLDSILSYLACSSWLPFCRTAFLWRWATHRHGVKLLSKYSNLCWISELIPERAIARVTVLPRYLMVQSVLSHVNNELSLNYNVAHRERIAEVVHWKDSVFSLQVCFYWYLYLWGLMQSVVKRLCCRPFYIPSRSMELAGFHGDQHGVST